MKAVTIIATLVIGMVAVAQPKGLEEFNEGGWGTEEVYNGYKLYDGDEDAYYMEIKREKLTLSELEIVVSELERILNANGANLDMFEKYMPASLGLDYSVNARTLFEKLKKNSVITYYYFVEGYLIILDVQKDGVFMSITKN